MTNEMKTLSDKDIKTLVNAYVEFKAAEAKFKSIKDALTKDIAPGKHVSEFGIVTKTVSTRSSVDYSKMLEDNPQIDVTEYTTEKEVVSVTIQNLTKAKTIFS